MTNAITHTGIVEHVSPNLVQVRIVQTSACAGCSVRAHCNASESKEKLIDVATSGWMHYSSGDSVRVQGSVGMGMQAVMWAFGVPFCIMAVTLFVAMQSTASEIMSAIIAMCSLVPYYLALYLKRNQLRKKFPFTIEKLTDN